MQDTRPSTFRRFAVARLGHCGALLLLMLGAGLAQAQTSAACEQFKGVLAKRISGGPGSFTLEDVPSDAAVPPGAKAVATCEGGARKILLTRTGQAAPAATAASDSPAAPPLREVRSATESTRPAPPAPTATAAAPAPAPSAPAPRSAPAEARAAPPTREPERGVPPPAGAPAESVVMPEAAASAAPLVERTTAFFTRHWLWLAALALLLAGGLRAWLAHRSAYDEAGLPRGPRLN
jgi:hypothetical protein